MADDMSTAERWAYFRHAVIGTLLIAPPEPGQLRTALLELSRKSFTHPVTGAPARVGFSTLEKWYYAARSGDDPFGQLRRKVRKDAGQQRAVSELLVAASLPACRRVVEALCKLDHESRPGENCVFMPTHR